MERRASSRTHVQNASGCPTSSYSPSGSSSTTSHLHHCKNLARVSLEISYGSFENSCLVIPESKTLSNSWVKLSPPDESPAPQDAMMRRITADRTFHLTREHTCGQLSRIDGGTKVGQSSSRGETPGRCTFRLFPGGQSRLTPRLHIGYARTRVRREYRAKPQ